MGHCTFCGESAGFLHSEHAECRSKAEAMAAEQRRLLTELELRAIEVAANGSAEGIREIAEKSAARELQGTDRRGTLVRAYGAAIDRLLDHEGVDDSHEKSIVAYANWLGLTDAEKALDGAQTKLAKALVLRDVAAGTIKSRVTVDFPLPFLFKKDEVIL